LSVVIVEELQDGRFIQTDVDKLLSDDVLTRRLRMEISRCRKRKETSPVRCGLCKEPIYLRRNHFGEEGYHFCHFRTDDPALRKCPQRTENHASIELMRCLKYMGAQESQLHYRLKHLIAELLKLDTSVESATVKIEKVLSQEKEWRRPDVQAVVNQRLTAFEVQVSTEMVAMIVAREHFYENFGSIIWILPAFDPDSMNQSQRDIQTTNNEHLFVLNDEMQLKSRKNGTLTLEVWVNWPTLDDKKIRWEWQRHEAFLNDISFRDGHAYLLDVQAEEARVRSQLQKELEEEAAKQQLARERESSQLQHERDKKFVVTEWGYWWPNFLEFCEELVEPSRRTQLRERLVKDNFWYTSSVSGLWLALHGIYARNCECNEFVVKALLCAAKGRLDYGYSSWKYIAKSLIRDHLIWFWPFYNVLKLNIGVSVLTELRHDHHIDKTISDLRRNPQILSDEQRKFLGLIEPNIGFDVTPYNLILPDSSGPSFYYSIQHNTPGVGSEVHPPDLNMVHHYMKRGIYGKLIMGRRSNNIIHILKYFQKRNDFVPFPNIPIAKPDSKYYIEYSECNEILPSWRKQLSTLENDFYSN